MKRAKQRPLRSLIKLAGLKGFVRRPEKPVSIGAMNAAIAAAGSKAGGSRKKYKLADLLAECDPNAPMPEDLVEWDRMIPVGKEIW